MNLPARPVCSTGTVLPAGHTLGIPAEHAGDANARDAYSALVAAGHTPALLANETDGDDVDTARGTGFMIDARDGSRVLVGHLVDGVDMWDSLPDTERRKILRGFRDTLLADGWETDRSVKGRRLYAWRISPLPERVTLAQTRGEVPQKPATGALGSMKNRKLADPEHIAEILTKRCQNCQGAGCPDCGYKPHRDVDSVNPQDDDGPYEVYGQPDAGYAADARRATLAEAQQVAEDGATARGLNPKGLGYHWDSREETAGHSVWTLRSVYDWAKPTGVSVEGPTSPDGMAP